MLLSKEDMFSEAQAITGTENAVTYSTNVLDWGAHGNDIDKELRLFILNTQAAVGAGASLTIAFETSADNTTFTTLKSYTAIAVGGLTVDTFLVKNDVLPDGLKRYNRLSFTVTGAALSTVPKLTAGLIRNDGHVTR
jgi:hypothetical protein